MGKGLSTLRHGVNLLGTAMASKLVPIASIFIFSHMMTVAEFGVVSLFTSFIWLFAITLSFNLHTALGRYAYLPDGDLPAFLGTLQIFLGVAFVSGTLLVLLARERFGEWTGLPTATLPLLLAVAAGQLAESLLTQWAIYRRESALLLRAVAGKALATLLLAISLLLATSSERYLAVAGADALLSIVMAVYAAWIFRKSTRWTIRWSLLNYAIRYSVPLIPYTLSITLLAQLDRMMIDRFYGKEATGLYSLAFNIGMLFALVMTAALNALNPRFFANMEARRHDRVIADGRGAFAIAFSLALAVVLAGPAVAGLLLPAQYEEALPLIPAISIGGLFLVSFQIWGRLLHFAHRTGLLSTIAVTCVLVKIAANLVVLPRWGWQAAALSSISAYAAMAILTAAVVNRKSSDFTLPVGLEFSLCLSLAAIAITLELAHLPTAWDIAARLAAVAAFAWPMKSMLLGLRSGQSEQILPTGASVGGPHEAT